MIFTLLAQWGWLLSLIYLSRYFYGSIWWNLNDGTRIIIVRAFVWRPPERVEVGDFQLLFYMSRRLFEDAWISHLWLFLLKGNIGIRNIIVKTVLWPKRGVNIFSISWLFINYILALVRVVGHIRLNYSQVGKLVACLMPCRTLCLLLRFFNLSLLLFLKDRFELLIDVICKSVNIQSTHHVLLFAKLGRYTSCIMLFAFHHANLVVRGMVLN